MEKIKIFQKIYQKIKIFYLKIKQIETQIKT